MVFSTKTIRNRFSIARRNYGFFLVAIILELKPATCLGIISIEEVNAFLKQSVDEKVEFADAVEQLKGIFA